MSELRINQTTIEQLLGDRNADFLIPDYQRPYAWGEKECQILWDDLFTFAFPDGDSNKFDAKKETYFLGPIVTISQEDKPREIIDGQQRMTTLMLLLRAFYTKYTPMHDTEITRLIYDIELCIWKTDEFKNVDINSCKLDTEVATDEAKQEFKDILRTGVISDKQQSNYANNYRFFLKKIEAFISVYPLNVVLFPRRIMQNCILLPIEANSQDMAMRIFSTLNDRGKPLADADIFKAQLYKYYDANGTKDNFIKSWKELEELCAEIYHPIIGTPMDEAFTRYMYYERAKQGNKNSTIESLRKFYEKDSYALLKKDETFANIFDLAKFWKSVAIQDKQRFSEPILKRLFVLNYAPNGMWIYITSVFYIVNRDENGILDDEKFFDFLNKITAFIFAYSFTNPGVNALRTPIYAAMIDIVKGEKLDFQAYKFDIQQLTNAINNYVFGNMRPITKSMLAWWAFNDEEQKLLDLSKSFQIEHIYAKKRYEIENGLSNARNIELLGNKVLLEDGINIRAADYRFIDKIKYYKGFTNTRGQLIGKTSINELLNMANSLTDFTESEIVQRNALIIQKFIDYLKKNDLIK